MVHGEAVLEAVRATGILRDVAADRADLLAGRIRRVVEVVAGDGLRDRGVEDPGLNDRALALRIDVDHAVQLGGDDQRTGDDRQRAAGQPGAGSAGDKRDAGVPARPYTGLNFARIGWQQHHPGCGPVGGQTVAFIRAQRRGVRDHGCRPSSARNRAVSCSSAVVMRALQAVVRGTAWPDSLTHCHFAATGRRPCKCRRKRQEEFDSQNGSAAIGATSDLRKVCGYLAYSGNDLGCRVSGSRRCSAQGGEQEGEPIGRGGREHHQIVAGVVVLADLCSGASTGSTRCAARSGCSDRARRTGSAPAAGGGSRGIDSRRRH